MLKKIIETPLLNNPTLNSPQDKDPEQALRELIIKIHNKFKGHLNPNSDTTNIKSIFLQINNIHRTLITPAIWPPGSLGNGIVEIAKSFQANKICEAQVEQTFLKALAETKEPTLLLPYVDLCLKYITELSVDVYSPYLNAYLSHHNSTLSTDLRKFFGITFPFVAKMISEKPCDLEGISKIFELAKEKVESKHSLIDYEYQQLATILMAYAPSKSFDEMMSLLERLKLSPKERLEDYERLLTHHLPKSQPLEAERMIKKVYTESLKCIKNDNQAHAKLLEMRLQWNQANLEDLDIQLLQTVKESKASETIYKRILLTLEVLKTPKRMAIEPLIEPLFQHAKKAIDQTRQQLPPDSNYAVSTSHPTKLEATLATLASSIVKYDWPKLNYLNCAQILLALNISGNADTVLKMIDNGTKPLLKIHKDKGKALFKQAHVEEMLRSLVSQIQGSESEKFQSLINSFLKHFNSPDMQKHMQKLDVLSKELLLKNASTTDSRKKAWEAYLSHHMSFMDDEKQDNRTFALACHMCLQEATDGKEFNRKMNKLYEIALQHDTYHFGKRLTQEESMVGCLIESVITAFFAKEQPLPLLELISRLSSQILCLESLSKNERSHILKSVQKALLSYHTLRKTHPNSLKHVHGVILTSPLLNLEDRQWHMDQLPTDYVASILIEKINAFGAKGQENLIKQDYDFFLNFGIKYLTKLNDLSKPNGPLLSALVELVLRCRSTFPWADIESKFFVLIGEKISSTKDPKVFKQEEIELFLSYVSLLFFAFIERKYATMEQNFDYVEILKSGYNILVPLMRTKRLSSQQVSKYAIDYLTQMNNLADTPYIPESFPKLIKDFNELKWACESALVNPDDSFLLQQIIHSWANPLHKYLVNLNNCLTKNNLPNWLFADREDKIYATLGHLLKSLDYKNCSREMTELFISDFFQLFSYLHELPQAESENRELQFLEKIQTFSTHKLMDRKTMEGSTLKNFYLQHFHFLKKLIITLSVQMDARYKLRPSELSEFESKVAHHIFKFIEYLIEIPDSLLDLDYKREFILSSLYNYNYKLCSKPQMQHTVPDLLKKTLEHNIFKIDEEDFVALQLYFDIPLNPPLDGEQILKGIENLRIRAASNQFPLFFLLRSMNICQAHKEQILKEKSRAIASCVKHFIKATTSFPYALQDGSLFGDVSIYEEIVHLLQKFDGSSASEGLKDEDLKYLLISLIKRIYKNCEKLTLKYTHTPQSSDETIRLSQPTPARIIDIFLKKGRKTLQEICKSGMKRHAITLYAFFLSSMANLAKDNQFDIQKQVFEIALDGISAIDFNPEGMGYKFYETLIIDAYTQGLSQNNEDLKKALRDSANLDKVIKCFPNVLQDIKNLYVMYSTECPFPLWSALAKVDG